MDYERFLRELPGLYDGWGGPAVRPRSDRFAAVLDRVRGMSSPGVLQLLNCAAGCLEGDEAYGEVGCYRGSTLVGALLGNAARAVAADDFSLFDPRGENRPALLANLESFGLSGRVDFRDQHCEEFLLGLRGGRERLGVYFYDGAHDYRSQLLGLLLAAPLLAPRALIVVDDANCAAPRQAAWDFVEACPQARPVLDLPTPGNCHPTFWNGLLALAWDAGGDNGLGWAAARSARQAGLLESLDLLQNVALSRGPGGVQARVTG